MPNEIDLSGEQDPEDRLQLHDEIVDPESKNEREPGYEGTEQVEDDVDEMMVHL